MNNDEIIKKVTEWQNAEYLHPLTCINSNHKKLEAKEVNGKVVLVCLDCNYIQEWIPGIVLTDFNEKMKSYEY